MNVSNSGFFLVLKYRMVIYVNFGTSSVNFNNVLISYFPTVALPLTSKIIEVLFRQERVQAFLTIHGKKRYLFLEAIRAI